MRESAPPDGAVGAPVAGDGRSRDPLDQVTDIDVAALASRAGVFRGTATDGIMRANERFAEITGLPDTVRGWDWLVAVHADDRERVRRAIAAACRQGARSAFPIRVQVRHGRVHALRVEVAGVPAGDGTFVFVGSVAEDATAARRRAANAESVEGDDPYRVLVDALPIAIAYAGPDGTIEFANDHWQRRTGIAAGAALAHAFGDPADAASVTHALRTGADWEGTVLIGGRSTPVTWTPVPDDHGGGGLLTMAEPGVGPGPADEAGAAGAPVAAFAGLLDASLDYAAIVERDGPVVYLNPAARALLGLAPDSDLDGIELGSFVEFHDGRETAFAESARMAVRQAGVHLAEGDLMLVNGGRRRVSMILLALTDGHGTHRATVCIARDATDLHDAEQRLIERERWYRALVQHAADLVVVLNADLSVRFASPMCRDLLVVEP